MRENRERSIGAGHPYAFETIEERVAVVLLYFKVYPTQEFLGLVLGVDQSAISRLISRMLPLIEEAADPELKTFLNKARLDSTSLKLRSPRTDSLNF